MFSSSQIGMFRTGTESVARQAINTEGTTDIEQSFIVEFLHYYTDIIFLILKSDVIPILEADYSNVDNEFNRHLHNFGKKIDEINQTTFERVDNLQEFITFISTSYNLLEQVIITYKIEGLTEKVLHTLGVLRDFDDIYLNILMKRPEQLSAVINNIRTSQDFQDFEKSRAGALLAFFCLLAYIKEEIDDNQKLSQLLKITDNYSTRLEAWADTIDIMSNPAEVEQMEEAEKYYNTR
jgi:hypothetical protein